MALQIEGISQMFSHSRNYDQGIGTRGIRVGMTVFLVALDGSGDFDTIEGAVDALPNAGGVIYIKEGTYKISSTITIDKNNVTLEGSGDSTIIKRKSDLAMDIIKIGNGSTTRRDITIKRIRIDDVTGSQASDGIELDKVQRVIIENCTILDVHNTPIVVDADSSDCKIIGCRMNKEMTIAGNNCWFMNNIMGGNFVVSGDDNKIFHNKFTPTSFTWDDAGSNRCIFIGNSIETGMDDDIYLTGTNNIFIGNVNKSATYNFDTTGATTPIFEHNYDA